jgi:hypothetical protein
MARIRRATLPHRHTRSVGALQRYSVVTGRRVVDEIRHP